MPHYLVAEDLFAACSEQARAMVPAVVAAVKVGCHGACCEIACCTLWLPTVSAVLQQQPPQQT